MSKLPRLKPLTIAKQNFWMKQIFPGFRFSAASSSWTGILKPSEISPEYLVRVTYEISDSPKVMVLHPPIHNYARHRFGDGSLCLYYFKDGSWNKQKILAQTILPWTAEWLFFYEYWLATGEWLGNEVSHNGRKKEL